MGEWDRVAGVPDIQVTYASRLPMQDGQEQITHLGNNAGRWTCQETIDWIELKHHSFYMVASGRRLDICVVSSPMGKHLRTRTDGRWTDSLTALPAQLATSESP